MNHRIRKYAQLLGLVSLLGMGVASATQEGQKEVLLEPRKEQEIQKGYKGFGMYPFASYRHSFFKQAAAEGAAGAVWGTAAGYMLGGILRTAFDSGEIYRAHNKKKSLDLLKDCWSIHTCGGSARQVARLGRWAGAGIGVAGVIRDAYNERLAWSPSLLGQNLYESVREGVKPGLAGLGVGVMASEVRVGEFGLTWRASPRVPLLGAAIGFGAGFLYTAWKKVKERVETLKIEKRVLGELRKDA